MKNLRFCLVALLLLLGAYNKANAKDVAHFDILLFGSKIGNLTASKETRADGSVLYLLDTWSKAKILWINHENITHYEVVYKDGKLISSNFKETENGELKRWSTTRWDGRQYNFDSPEGKKTFTEAPTYSVVLVYFQSMEHVTRIFYEIDGNFDKLENTEPGTYEFKSGDGNRNIYHFRNGVVQNMEFHVSIATVKMERVN